MAGRPGPTPKQGSGITYLPTAGDRDIEVRPDNPSALTASKFAPDSPAYSPAVYTPTVRPEETAYDSHWGQSWMQHQVYANYNSTEKYGLGFADRYAGDELAGHLNVLARQGDVPGQSQLTQDEIDYYSSGGASGGTFDPAQIGVAGYGVYGATLRDSLLADIDSRQDAGTRATWLAMHSPAALAAIADQGFKNEDVATAHNVYVALQARDQAMAYLDEGLPIAAAQLIQILPVKQQILAAAFLMDAQQERNTEYDKVKAEEAATQATFDKQNEAGSLDATTIGTSIAPIPTNVAGQMGPDGGGQDVLNWLIEATLFGVENVTRAFRAMQFSPDNAGDDYGMALTPAGGETPKFDTPLSELSAVWDAVGEDFISQTGYNDLVDQYGKDKADLALGLYRAERSDDPNAMETFKASIADDPMAVARIQNALSGRNVAGDDLAEVMVALYAKDQGNLGASLARGVNLDPQTIPFSVSRDVINVVSWFAFDPLLWAGVAGKSFRGLKYGLEVAERMGGMGNVVRAKRLGPWAESRILGRVTGFNGVRSEYDDFGSAIAAYKKTDDEAVKATIAKNARKRWMGKRNSMLGSDDWTVGVKYDLRTADDWANYFDDVDKAGQILAGRRVRLEAPLETMDDAFNRINAGMQNVRGTESFAREGMDLGVQSVVGQQVRRGVYVPHATVARATVRAMLATQWDNTTAAPYISRAVEALGTVIADPKWELADADGRLAILRDAFSNNETVAKAIGLEWGDFKIIDGEMQRTLVGRFVDRLFDHSDDARRVGMMFGFFKQSNSKAGTTYLKVKGWKRDRSLFDPVGRARGMRESWAKLATRLPNLPNGLAVDTAEHADEVYRMAVQAGIGRGGADLIRLAWVEGTAASRQNMMIGLTRTFTASLGLDAVDPHLASRIMREMTGLRAKEEYAANVIPDEAGIRMTVREEVEWVNGQRRMEIAGRPNTQSARIGEIQARLAEVDDLIARGGVSVSPEDVAFAKGLDVERRGLAKELASIQKRIATAEKGPSKAELKRIEAQATDDWWEGGLDGADGTTTFGDALDLMAHHTPGSWTRMDQSMLRKGYLPKRWATYWRDRSRNPNVKEGDLAVVSPEDEGRRFLDGNMKISDDTTEYVADWTAIVESAEKHGIGSYVPVPWAKTGIAKARRDAVDQATMPDDVAEELAARLASKQADIDMIDEWLAANADAVAATKPGAKPGNAAAVKAVQAEKKKLIAERTKLKNQRSSEDKRLLAGIDDDRDTLLALKAEELPGGRLDLASRQTNPSIDGNGKASAVYMGQTRGNMAVPNFKAMDQYAARQSFLNSFLFQGQAGTQVTEAWVLGSLYGPRFALRNAFEDIAMYVLTGGKVGRFFRGRRIDEAVDESMARVTKQYLARKQGYDEALRNFEHTQSLARANRADPNQLAAAEEALSQQADLLTKAEAERTLFRASKFGRRGKRGIVRTSILNLSERLTWDKAGRERDGIIAGISRLMAPTTSPLARREALEQGPEAMILLAEKAVLRQNVVWNRPGWRKIVPARAEKASDLSPRQLQYLLDEEDFLRSAHGLTYKDMAAEAASHLMDGSVPTLTNGGRFVYNDKGKLMRRISVDEGYKSVRINSNVLSPQQARGMMARLGFMADNYGLNQAALHQIPEYWKALNAVGGPDMVAVDKALDTVLDFAQRSSDWPFIASRFRLADDLGAKEHVRRMMDDMAAAFTRRGTGSEKNIGEFWNQNLWSALRHENKNTGKVTFSVQKPDGRMAVSEEDFLLGKFETPQSVLVHGSEGYVDVPHKGLWSEGAWSQMGRSMSRMSRNPIFYSNYLDSRAAMRPLERKWASVFGEEAARRKFADAAAERAYELTMSFVDNPNIRTNLSWQVRNIARYYRAQEDFARRVLRMVKFDPVSIQKANLAWQAQQDFGFVHRDDFGNDYFMYPGSAGVMAAVQKAFNVIGMGDSIKYGIAPMAFSGNVQWLSPSLDLGSAAPTVSSPWMAVTLQPALRWGAKSNDFFKVVERYAFGDVSSNMDYTDLNLGDGPGEMATAAFYQTLPPAVKKLLAVGEGLWGSLAPGSYGAKMTLKTIISMEAAGLGLSPQDAADPEKVKAYREALEQRTVEISIMSLIFGFAAPASPQYSEDMLSMSAREQGLTLLAPGLKEGITASVNAGAEWEDAYITWLRHNPKMAGVVVPLSESAGGAYVEATYRNVDFIKSNMTLFKEVPLGVTFFVPDPQGAGGGEEGKAAYRSMKTFGLREHRAIEPVINDVLMAEGRLEEKILRQDIAALEASTPHYDAEGNLTPQWRALQDEADRANYRLNGDYPTKGQGYEVPDKDSFRPEAAQIVTANRALRGDQGYADAASGLVESYEEFRVRYDQFLTGGGGTAELSRDEMKTRYKEVWQDAVSAWWADNRDKYPEERADRMVYTFTSALNTQWDITLEGQ